MFDPDWNLAVDDPEWLAYGDRDNRKRMTSTCHITPLSLLLLLPNIIYVYELVQRIPAPHDRNPRRADLTATYPEKISEPPSTIIDQEEEDILKTFDFAASRKLFQLSEKTSSKIHDSLKV
jgi:hypothetical protein